MAYLYKLVKITPLGECTKKDIKALNLSISQTDQSKFSHSRRMGACLVVGNQYILWGEPT